MKRNLAFILAIVLVFGMFPLNAIAADGPTITFTTDAGDALHLGDTISITAEISGNTGFASSALTMKWNNEVVEFVGFTGEYEGEDFYLEPSIFNNMRNTTVIVNNDLGYITSARSANSTENGVLFVAEFRVVGYGDCSISMDQSTGDTFFLADADGVNLEVGIDDAAIADLSVAEPAEEKTGYEVYYVLNDANGNEIAVDTDQYTNLGVNDTVTAEIFMASYSGNMTLQAYDIYLTYSDALVYQSEDMAGTAYVAGAAYDTVAAAGEKLSHITLVDGKTTIALSSEPVSLGTVTFAINGDTTVNGEQLAITLTEAEDTNANGGKQENVTNFSVGTDAAGNKQSYYPTVGGDVLGVEVDQTWTITWDADNGSDPVTVEVGHNEMPNYGENDPVKAPDDEFTYTFASWTPAVVKATADATYTATYTTTTNSYTVTWLNWDGTPLGTDTVAYGETPTYTGEEPTRPEDAQYTYEFDGWTPEISAVTGDVTYTATYNETAKTYTVTFHPNEGSGTMDPQSAAYGEKITLSPNGFTAPEGKKFVNWNTKADGSGTPYGANEEFTVTESVTLYAIWEEADYTVESVTEGVSVDKAAANFGSTITVTVTIPEGNELTAISAINAVTGETVDLTKTAEGVYTFTMPASNVKLEVTPTFEKVDLDVVIDEDIENGTVTDPGTAQVDDTVKLESTPDEGYVVEDYTVTYEKDGQTIEVPVSDDGTFTMPGYPVTVTATFRKIQFTVQFNANDGSETPATATQNFIHGEVQNLTANAFPAPDNKVFAGWALTASGEVAYEDKAEFSSTTANDGDIVILYAIWENATYKITLETNGGTIVEGEVTEYTYGSVTKLPTNVTKTNYTFGGWYADPNFSGDKVTEIGATESGDKTFYAKWDVDFICEVEDYAYALEGYVMVRIATTANADAYTLAGFEMYYTDTDEYKIGENGVFVTLIPEYVELDGVDTQLYVVNETTKEITLTPKAIESLVKTGQEAKTIDRDGDVNGDDVVNIADANIVYQMQTEKGPGYYTDLSTLDRLEADVCTSLDQAVNRASTLDVHWIVNLINGVSNTESTN